MKPNPISYRRQKMFLECSCGCSVLAIDYWDDDGMVFLEHYLPSFYTLQETIWRKFAKIIKIIWYILRGKEYWFFDISFESKKQIREFKEFVASIDENKCEYDE